MPFMRTGTAQKGRSRFGRSIAMTSIITANNPKDRGGLLPPMQKAEKSPKMKPKQVGAQYLLLRSIVHRHASSFWLKNLVCCVRGRRPPKGVCPIPLPITAVNSIFARSTPSNATSLFQTLTDALYPNLSRRNARKDKARGSQGCI